jgi:phospholipid-binding lipoprotein MlaA
MMRYWTERLMILMTCCAISGGVWAQGMTQPQVDPWESFNRKMFSFNDSLDQAVLKPVARTYVEMTPSFIRTGVSNFFGNLRDLWSAANSALQAKPGPALENTGRFLVNTTVGIYGLFDVATPLGLERHTEDLGQTLGWWGVSSGPYVVLPLFGPSTVRDGLGLVVDSQASIISHVSDISHRNTLYAGRIVDLRAQLLPITDQVERVALDKYTFTRDAYLQKRRNDIYDGDPPDDDASNLDVAPDTAPADSKQDL